MLIPLAGETTSSAGKLALKKMLEKVNGAGGLIIINRSPSKSKCVRIRN